MSPCAASSSGEAARCRAPVLITAAATSLKVCARPVPQLKMPDTLAVLEELQVHRDDVVDVDEIAPLLAVGVAARADEQLHPALRP